MIHIIIPTDPSTHFLYGIIDSLKSSKINFNLIEIEANDESYLKSKKTITSLDKESIIIFLGHGQENSLYGGENLPDYQKKVFVKRDEMKIFENQFLFILACDSSDLLKSSFKHSKFIKSIGFGGLPTSRKEVDNNKKISGEEISEETIDKFKASIVDAVSKALILYTNDFIYLKDYLKLLLDKKINDAVLINHDSNLADLLFRMRSEMTIY